MTRKSGEPQPPGARKEPTTLIYTTAYARIHAARKQFTAAHNED